MKPIRIFRSEKDNRVSYSMGVSCKLQDGSYQNGYFPVQFKKDVELSNNTEITPTDWNISFYTNNKGEKVYKLCVWEFAVGQALNQAPKEDNTQDTSTDQPYIDFGNQVELSDDDIAF
jgi:hypothetical protein